jgi:hypothetical protein
MSRRTPYMGTLPKKAENMFKKTKLRFGAVAVVVCTATLFGAISASADPAAGVFKTLSGVGSDTTQDVVAGLATAVSSIGSYDATGTATIQTKSGGPVFTRPNGSGSGVQALSDSAQGGSHLWNTVDVTGQVDFARSSSGPSGSGTVLTYIPFAKDAVSFAVNAASDFPRDIPVGAASQDATAGIFSLRNIYRCTATSFTDSNGLPVTIRPLLPQSGSGTRKFWLSTLGLSETDITAGGCATDLGNTVEEHNGTFLTGAGDIAPFSIAQYIAQGNWKSLPSAVIERRGSIVLGQIGGVKPYSITTAGATLNTGFPVTRNVYNVVQTSRLAETAVAAAFVGSSSSVCANAAIIKQYGFGTIGSLCGSTSTTGPYTQ